MMLFLIHLSKRMNIGKKLVCALLTTLLFISSTYAGWIDHFQVIITPENPKVWETLDLEIQAVDKNDNIVTDYDGTILIFSESDPEAELPSALEENTYTFELANQWKIKFENAVKFKNQWNQDIHVYDLNDDTVLWIWEVQVEEDESNARLDISIISPESWLTLPEDSVNVSGTSQKNHSIHIILNGKETFKTTTDNNGIFEKEIDWLENWENSIKAQVLNADGDIVWESEEVKIDVESALPKLKNLTIDPEEVEVENSYYIELITSEWLSEVKVIINDNLISLEKDEKSETKWSKQVYAPAKAGNYKIDVILKDELGHEIKELGAGNLVVMEPELKSAETEEKTQEPLEAADSKENQAQEKDLKITGIKVVELKSKSILTWDETPGAESYNLYKKIKDDDLELIANVKKPEFEIEFSWDNIKYDYFAIRALGRWEEIDEVTGIWELYEWSLSDATKVKTWPEVLLLLILSLFIWWIIFIIKQKKA